MNGNNLKSNVATIFFKARFVADGPPPMLLSVTSCTTHRPPTPILNLAENIADGKEFGKTQNCYKARDLIAKSQKVLRSIMIFS